MHRCRSPVGIPRAGGLGATLNIPLVFSTTAVFHDPGLVLAVGVYNNLSNALPAPSVQAVPGQAVPRALPHGPPPPF